MRDTQLTTGEIYHICNRAVEGRRIFTRNYDCAYFLETALLVQSTESRPLDWRRAHLRSLGELVINKDALLIGIYALCLMPNHFHILLEQKVNDGIAKFLQRLCNSYGKYYNLKYKRDGSLFKGPYKAVHIKSDPQAAHIFTYIHANPLDIVEPQWREGRIKDWSNAVRFLKKYRWSSLGIYHDTEMHPDFDRLVNPAFAKNYFLRTEDHMENIKNWSSRNESAKIDIKMFE